VTRSSGGKLATLFDLEDFVKFSVSRFRRFVGFSRREELLLREADGPERLPETVRMAGRKNTGAKVIHSPPKQIRRRPSERLKQPKCLGSQDIASVDRSLGHDTAAW